MRPLMSHHVWFSYNWTVCLPHNNQHTLYRHTFPLKQSTGWYVLCGWSDITFLTAFPLRKNLILHFERLITT